MTSLRRPNSTDAAGESAASSVDLSVDVAPGNRRHLRLANPVMIASGTFGYDGYGRGMPQDGSLARLGAIIPKTVTRQPREGNPEPRWYPASFREGRAAGETTFLNSIGLANPGIEAALAQLAPQWARYGTTVVLSLSGESAAQFGEMAALAQGAPGFQALELNLSCPNIENGAHFSHDPKLAAAAVAAVRANSDLPLLVKLSPNVPDITVIARAVVSAGADALTLSNTIPAMKIDLGARRPVLGAVTGGLSGPGLKPVAMALVYRTVQAVDVPVIGVGGIFTAADALEYLMAGATAVQVGSATLADPRASFTILDGIRDYLSTHGIASVREVVGAAQVKTRK
ncbi:MAG: dihydroorotate dehydrogenase [SAR202 cluster bacterium]|nr:dihydroorotate dehydrogenase [SAR202 cluster bacterium]